MFFFFFFQRRKHIHPFQPNVPKVAFFIQFPQLTHTHIYYKKKDFFF